MTGGGKVPRPGAGAGRKKPATPTIDQIEEKLIDAGADVDAFIDELGKFIDEMDTSGPPSEKRKKPKPYRKHINAFKHLREHGTGLLTTWKPETFRDYVEGYRQAIVMDIILAVGAVLYILYRIFLK